MNLTLVLILLMLVGVAFGESSQVKNPKRFFIIWCSIIMLLSISLKSAYYGTLNDGGADTLSYVQSYKETINFSFSDVWQRFLNRYIYQKGEDDIGYLLLTWIFSRFTNSYHIFSTVADLLFFIPFAKLIDKYSHSIGEVFFAYLFYLSIFHTMGLFGARQFYAMGFGLMFFLFYSEKRYKEAFTCFFVGLTLHMSLLLVLIPFVISFLSGKAIRFLHIISLIMIPVTFFAANEVIYFMGDTVGIERYANYGLGELRGGAGTYIILSEILSLLLLMLMRTRELNDDNIKYIYSMIPVFTFFAPLINSNGSMMRITAYSQIYITVLVPCFMNNRFGKIAKTYIVLSIVILLFFILKGEYQPYYFFWQTDPIGLW